MASIYISASELFSPALTIAFSLCLHVVFLALFLFVYVHATVNIQYISRSVKMLLILGFMPPVQLHAVGFLNSLAWSVIQSWQLALGDFQKVSPWFCYYKSL